MKKMLYIARVATQNSDDYIATFDKTEAQKQAYQYKGHLTERELKDHTVTVEGYSIDVPEDDNRTAKQVYFDLCNESCFEPEADEYEEV